MKFIITSDELGSFQKIELKIDFFWKRKDLIGEL